MSRRPTEETIRETIELLRRRAEQQGCGLPVSGRMHFGDYVVIFSGDGYTVVDKLAG